MIVWCDIESSSLDEREGHLLEVAFVVTDDELRERAATSVVVKPLGIDVSQLTLPLVVREMHEKSGLLADLERDTALARDAAASTLTSWLAQTFGHIEDLRKIPLAGSTIAFDRRWLRAQMPSVEALFSYRSIDVSALTELALRWSPAVHNDRPKKDAGVAHRALEDARQSAQILRYYRERGFVGGSR